MGFINSTMRGSSHGNRFAGARGFRDSGRLMRAASSLAKGLIVVVMNPFITFVTATEPIDDGRARRDLARRLRWSATPTPFGARRDGDRYPNPV
jgi:hypothetical protein